MKLVDLVRRDVANLFRDYARAAAIPEEVAERDRKIDAALAKLPDEERKVVLQQAKLEARILRVRR